MTDRLSELESRVAELTEALRSVTARLSALERAAPARRRAPAPAPPPRAAATGEPAAANRSVALAGRTLLALAGAFLLRALADRGVPASLALAAGLAYAVGWLLAADRAGAGRAFSAVFHGLAAVLVGFPLLFEAAARFEVASPAVASLGLTAFTGAALAVAARRRLHALAWLATGGGVATAVALAAATGRLVPPALFLVLLGVATLWIGYVLDWFDLRWPAAAAADLAVLAVAVRALAPGAAEGPRLAAAAQVALIALTLGSVATRTLVLGRRVVAFEVVQTCGVLATGLGGAALVAARTGGGSAVVGVICLALGAASYAVGFAFERREAGRANFAFYASIGIVLVLAGSALVLDGPGPALAWAAAAVLAAAAAGRTRRSTLAAHAAGYAAMAALGSGAVAYAAAAAFSSPGADAGFPPAAVLAVTVALAAAAFLGAAPSPAAASRLRDRVPRLAVVAMLAVSAGGVVLGAVDAALARAGAADAGASATVRTGILAAVAVALAALGRSGAWAEAGWLAYPLLGVLGVKILLQDLAQGRPATLVLAFAAYGAALLLVPRLRRRERAAAPVAAR